MVRRGILWDWPIQAKTDTVQLLIRVSWVRIPAGPLHFIDIPAVTSCWGGRAGREGRRARRCAADHQRPFHLHNLPAVELHRHPRLYR